MIKAIKDFPGYEIDDNGNIYSYWGKTVKPKWRTGSMTILTNERKLLKPFLVAQGRYYAIHLTKGDKRHIRLIHRLVLETFKGKCPKGMEGCHNDGNSFNNHISNLRWDTRSNNALDSVKHGTHPRLKFTGEKSVVCKFKDSKLKRMILLKEVVPSISCSSLSKIFKISPIHIWRILNNRSRKYLINTQ